MSSLYELAYVGTDVDGVHSVRVEGTIPPALRGALIRNGAGSLHSGPDPLGWLDGHGMVIQVTFDENGVMARSRFVGTPSRKKDLDAGKMTARRLSTNLPSRWKNLFNLSLAEPANHDVYAWRGSLWASGATAHFELDAYDLSTKSQTRWPELGTAKMDQLCQMPVFDPATGGMIGFITKPGMVSPDKVVFFEYDANGKLAHKSAEIPLRCPGAPVHDQAFTARWYVAPEIGVAPSVPSVLWGHKPVWSCIEEQQDHSTMILIPRGREGAHVRVPLQARKDAVVFHIANAFDDGDNVVVDGIAYDKFPDFAKAASQELRERTGVDWKVNAGMPRVVRWVIDPKAAKVISTQELGAGETPCIDPRFEGQKSNVIFLNAPCTVGDEPAPAYFFYFHGVNRVEADKGVVATWSAGANNLCGPPAFVPRSADAPEGDGWLLAWVTDGADGNTDIVVLDSTALEKGPVARVHLDIKVPTVSHTHWVPAQRA